METSKHMDFSKRINLAKEIGLGLETALEGSDDPRIQEVEKNTQFDLLEAQHSFTKKVEALYDNSEPPNVEQMKHVAKELVEEIEVDLASAKINENAITLSEGEKNALQEAIFQEIKSYRAETIGNDASVSLGGSLADALSKIMSGHFQRGALEDEARIGESDEDTPEGTEFGSMSLAKNLGLDENSVLF